jgi:hypothetical protein
MPWGLSCPLSSGLFHFLWGQRVDFLGGHCSNCLSW